MRIPILHQDPDLIVVDKPAGIPTHATDPRDPYAGDALRILQAQTGQPYLGMHQRLDAETSGVLLFAARRAANAALARAFEGRAVQKTYLALVHGAPPRPEGVIELPLVRDHGERYRVAAASDPRGLAARTRYRVLATAGDGEQTALEVIPETGRPHQIRVHLAAIGCPVVGDPLYDPRRRPAPRLCLHAYRLTIPHPATGEAITFTAPAPVWCAPTPPAHEHVIAKPVVWAEAISPIGEDCFAPQGCCATAKDTPHNNGKRAGSAREEGATLPASGRGAPHAGGFAPAGSAARHLARHAPGALRDLLRLAIDRRAPLAADPAISIYRLVNAAADGLPGLTVDRYSPTLVLSLYDEAEPVAPCPPALIAALAEITGCRSIYVKYRPKAASRLTEAQMAARAPARPIYGPAQDEFVAHEDSLAYLIRPGAGLSVGLFPDMRETRGRVRVWASGKRVLNCFAYTCGFGVAAMAGGADRVLNLDLSTPVLEWGKANYRINRFVADDHDFVFGDVFDWLGRLAKRNERFDLVILDPPGFSRTKTRHFAATDDYADLAALAARVTAADGLLLACCNVAELPWRAFRERVLAGVAAAGRRATVAGVYHEPALDFPAAPGAANYLKILAARLG
jgi:23S rRNA (cytosine1962-C5)-methyltransferase